MQYKKLRSDFNRRDALTWWWADSLLNPVNWFQAIQNRFH